LPGITRALVLETARARGIGVTEAAIAPEELAGADELFLTSSLVGLRPAVAVGGRPIGNGRPGRITGELQAAWLGLQR
jgi:branched-subunit amino acid aminotransferase/4-amino-4-deoxychorismate lyase